MKISLCVITKDEEANITRCISSVKAIVDEIIVVDTGSRDNTINIAKAMGAKVISFEWIDDFAAAKNYALNQAKGNWIIFLDADEYIDIESSYLIKIAIEEAGKRQAEAIVSTLINIENETKELLSTATTIRIFKRDSSIMYVGKIHERIEKVEGSLKLVNALESIRIFHTGYSKAVIADKEKAQRNIQLLYEDLQENPFDSNIHFYLIESFNIQGNLEKALIHCEKVFKYNNGNLTGIYQKTYAHQINIMVQLSFREEQILNVYRKAIKYDESYPDYDYLLGNYYLIQKEHNKATIYLEQCIGKMEKYNGDTESWSLTAVKRIYQVLANIYYKLGDIQNFIKKMINLLQVYKEDEAILANFIDKLRKYQSLDIVAEIINKVYSLNEEDRVIILKACILIGNSEVSEFFLQQLKEDRESSKESRRKIVSELINNGQLEKAKSDIKQYEKDYPNDIETYSMSACLAIIEGDLLKAEEELSKILVDDKDNVEALYNMGIVEGYKKNYEGSIKLFLTVLTLTNREEIIEGINEILRDKVSRIPQISKMIECQIKVLLDKGNVQDVKEILQKLNKDI